ncbi:2-amino-4-hydroxy-6-hydroxymethyldihydropteridine diphosphokinase [Pseudoroseicyclus sp. H15]
MPQAHRQDTSGHLVVIALGSNLDGASLSRNATLHWASRAIEAAAGAPVRISRTYRSAAYPAGIGPDFVNAVCVVRWDAEPEAILSQLHAIEAEAGRERQTRWGPRTLDLDLIAAGAAVRPDREGWAAWVTLPEERQRVEAPDRLVLPHPRMADRAFVLLPLTEVAPEWRHPVTGLTAAEMLAELPGANVAALTPLEGQVD